MTSFFAGFFAFIISLVSCIFLITLTGDLSGIIYNNSADRGFFTSAIDLFVFTYLISVTIFFYRTFTNNNNFGKIFLSNLETSIVYLILLFIIGIFLSVFIENIIYGNEVNRAYSTVDWYLDWIFATSFWIFSIVIILTIIQSNNFFSDNKDKNTADLNVTDKQEKFLFEVRAKNEKDSLKVVQKKELEENKSAEIEDNHQSFMTRGTILEKETTDEVIIEKIEVDELMDEENFFNIKKNKPKKADKDLVLSKEEALNKLKEHKTLLDLEIITQEEYDKVKDELKLIIIS